MSVEIELKKSNHNNNKKKNREDLQSLLVSNNETKSEFTEIALYDDDNNNDNDNNKRNRHDSYHNNGKTSWYHASAMIVGEIMGTGVMGLPKAMSGLGWGLGIFACLFFTYCAYYSGVLLSKVKHEYYPNVKSYAEIAEKITGYKFKYFTEFCILFSWILTTPYYLMAATNSLVIAFYNIEGICYYSWAIILMFIMIIPLQKRTLHDIRNLTLASDIAVILVLIIILLSFIIQGKNDNVITSFTIPNNTNGLEIYGNFSSFIFAYLGQAMFLEIMSEMKDSKQFPKSIYIGNTIMMIVYLLTCIIAYGYKGNDIDGFLPASLANNFIKTIVGILLCFHIIVSYLLVSQVLCSKLHEKIYPHSYHRNNYKTKKHWFIITISVLIFSYFIANLVPFFSDFQGFIGAALGAPIMFAWPSYFYIKSSKLHGFQLNLKEKIITYLFLYILFPTCTIFGIIIASKNIINDWNTYGKPFDCILAGFD